MGNEKVFKYNTRRAISDLADYIESELDVSKEIIIMCIGTDKCTGDSLGPLVGTLLSKRHKLKNKVKVVGTLENPLHALTLPKYKDMCFKGKFVIAVDAAVGSESSVDDIKIELEALKPGESLGKDLGEYGDISIKGVVCQDLGLTTFSMLTVTRMNKVYNMANVIQKAIYKALKNKLNF